MQPFSLNSVNKYIKQQQKTFIMQPLSTFNYTLYFSLNGRPSQPYGFDYAFELPDILDVEEARNADGYIIHLKADRCPEHLDDVWYQVYGADACATSEESYDRFAEFWEAIEEMSPERRLKVSFLLTWLSCSVEKAVQLSEDVEWNEYTFEHLEGEKAEKRAIFQWADRALRNDESIPDHVRGFVNVQEWGDYQAEHNPEILVWAYGSQCVYICTNFEQLAHS